MRKPTHLMRKEGRTDRDPTQGEEFQLHLLLRIESHKWELQPAVGHTHTHTHRYPSKDRWLQRQLETAPHATRRQTQTQTSRQATMH